MRRNRILLEGALYHVTARVNRQELAMDDPVVKEMFLKVLGQAKKKFMFTISNLMVMGNHYHLIIKPGNRFSLSEIMKWIQQTMAIRYNRAHGLTGHFWGDRFYSRIISSILEYARTFLYINLNPVRAGLVADHREWSWGFEKLKIRLGYLFEYPPPELDVLLQQDPEGEGQTSAP